ncbi:hypothetical protein ACFL6C_05380 [Myxococcota bacterium]
MPYLDYSTTMPSTHVVLPTICLSACQPLVGLPTDRLPNDQGRGDHHVVVGDGSRHGDRPGGEPSPGDSQPSDPMPGDRLPGDTSPGDTYTPRCGNGTIDTGEVCDDGNTNDGDTCDSTCAYGVIEVAKSMASDGEEYDRFGAAVSISGDLLVVGAPAEDQGGDRSGAAYLYERNQGGNDRWGEVTKLVRTNPNSYDNFGDSVAVSGDIVLVGASGAWGSEEYTGAAFVFDGSAAWDEVKRLWGSDAEESAGFGNAVSFNADIAVVGASTKGDGWPETELAEGGAYVFYRSSDTWPEVKRLDSPEPQEWGYFGRSVAVSAATLAVGSSQRAVWLYGQNQGGNDNWGQLAKVTPLAGEVDDRFGASVALDGDTLVIGAWGEQNNVGAAYVLYRDHPTTDAWGQVKRLTASVGDVDDYFGGNVAIDGSFVLVTAGGDDDMAEDAGAVYLFERNQGGPDNWGLWAKFVTSDSRGWYFLSSVAISGKTVAVGNQLARNEVYEDVGAVYVFEIVP